MKANLGIPKNSLQKLATILNTTLSDEFLLYTKTRNYHWNVQGPNFMELHKFFENQYEELAEIIDDTAERVRSLGHFALGSMKAFLGIARLLESDSATTDSQAMLQNLLDDHENLARLLRNDIDACADMKDTGTADFLTGLLKYHEKTAWMIRSYVIG